MIELRDASEGSLNVPQHGHGEKKFDMKIVDCAKIGLVIGLTCLRYSVGIHTDRIKATARLRGIPTTFRIAVFTDSELIVLIRW